MRVQLTLAVAGVAMTAGLAGPALAVNSEQFCKAATLIANAARADVGTWLDRNTRNDGVEVICGIRTVNFKRYLNVPMSGLGKDWPKRKQQEWNSIHCNDQVWREAINDGWIILSTTISVSGERAQFIATCR